MPHAVSFLRYQVQHRMRPEISAAIRELTYPELVDAPKTHNRPHIRGLRSSVVFVTHEHNETETSDMQEQFSHTNQFEVRMCVQVLIYLLQQGYRTDDIVVLTPYLGQLLEIRRAISTQLQGITASLGEQDAADLDRQDTVEHVDTALSTSQQSIRVSTVDNFQGEEAKIVVASLVRSNNDHKVGFVADPERVNVLLSRARDGMILIGDLGCFLQCPLPRVRTYWERLATIIRSQGLVCAGLPTRCVKHPDHVQLLRTPGEFLKHSPKGGCQELCASSLPCGHACPFQCHPTDIHPTIKCQVEFGMVCDIGHNWTRLCHEPHSCKVCARQRELARLKQLAAQQANDKLRSLREELDRKREDVENRRIVQKAELEAKDALDNLQVRIVELLRLFSTII
jgi:hypothetical protein